MDNFTKEQQKEICVFLLTNHENKNMQIITNVTCRSNNKNNIICNILCNMYTTVDLALLLTDNTFTSLDIYQAISNNINKIYFVYCRGITCNKCHMNFHGRCDTCIKNHHSYYTNLHHSYYTNLHNSNLYSMNCATFSNMNDDSNNSVFSNQIKQIDKCEICNYGLMANCYERVMDIKTVNSFNHKHKFMVNTW